MNAQEQTRYYGIYKRLFKQLLKKYQPLVEKALRQQIKEFTKVIEQIPSARPQLDQKPLRKALKGIHIYSGVANARIVSKDLRRQLRKGMNDQEKKWAWVINQYLKENGLDKLTFDISKTLRDKIIKVLETSNTQGLGIKETVKLLNDSSFPRWMAERIVRTELTKATNAGAMIAAADSGVMVNKEWISAQDNRTRRIPRNDFDHLHMNGKQVAMDDDFIVPSMVSVEALNMPGDAGASAGNVCNCRCTVAFVPVRDRDGKPVAVNKPVIQSSGRERQQVNIFYDLLQQAAEIGVTGFIVDNLINEDE